MSGEKVTKCDCCDCCDCMTVVSAISREATVYGEGGSPGEGWHAQQKKRATPELAELRRHSWDFRF